MSRDEILRILGEHSADVRQFGIKSLAIFGSAARDQARADSDVDILVEFDPPPTFERYMDLKFYLEDLLKCRVDLGTPDMLKPRIRAQVESEALRVIEEQGTPMAVVVSVQEPHMTKEERLAALDRAAALREEILKRRNGVPLPDSSQLVEEMREECDRQVSGLSSSQE